MTRKPASELLEGKCFIAGDGVDGGEDGLFFRFLWVGIDCAGVI